MNMRPNSVHCGISCSPATRISSSPIACAEANWRLKVCKVPAPKHNA